MSSIMILGHRGFIGTGLMEYFKSRTDVVGWGREENIFNLTAEKFAELYVDIIVNCAVVMDRSSKVVAPDSPSDEVNVRGARHLADILRGSHIGWIQISTKDVFGSVYNQSNVSEGTDGFWPKFLVDDNQPFSPETAYAKSKLMSEFIAEGHSKTTIIRLSACYMPHDHRRANWMVFLIREILKGNSIGLTNGGKQFRDPLHTDDLGRLIESVIQHKRWGLKMNAGGGEANIISVGEFVRLVSPKVKVKSIPGGDFGFAFNNRVAMEGGYWTPTISIRDTMSTLISNVRADLKTT